MPSPIQPSLVSPVRTTFPLTGRRYLLQLTDNLTSFRCSGIVMVRSHWLDLGNQMLLHPKNGFNPIAQIKLTQNPADVVSDGSITQVQNLGNFLIVFAFTN
jgi:hypothetical protein